MKKIGITETYDPCFVPDWETKLLEANIVISKELNDEMIEKLLIVQDRVIFHHTVTGQGGTILEPNVQTPEHEFAQFRKLLSRGFPLTHYVLRLDPIILWSKETQGNIIKVLELWKPVVEECRNQIRCRVSVVDLYPHVKERLAAAGYKLFYDTFTAPDAVFRRIGTIFCPFYQYFLFECCAEPKLFPITSCTTAVQAIMTWNCSDLTGKDRRNMGLQTKNSVGTVNVSPRNRFLERNLADAHTAACIASGRDSYCTLMQSIPNGLIRKLSKSTSGLNR